MSDAFKRRPTGPFSPQYINGVYIPSALLIIGFAIVKKEWLPFAVLLAAILGGWKVYNNREPGHTLQRDRLLTACRNKEGP